MLKLILKTGIGKIRFKENPQELIQVSQWADQAQKERMNLWKIGDEEQTSLRKSNEKKNQKSKNYE